MSLSVRGVIEQAAMITQTLFALALFAFVPLPAQLPANANEMSTPCKPAVGVEVFTVMCSADDHGVRAGN